MATNSVMEKELKNLEEKFIREVFYTENKIYAWQKMHSFLQYNRGHILFS